MTCIYGSFFTCQKMCISDHTVLRFTQACYITNTCLTGQNLILFYCSSVTQVSCLRLDSEKKSSALMVLLVSLSFCSIILLAFSLHCSTTDWLLGMLLLHSFWAILYRDCRMLSQFLNKIKKIKYVLICVFYILHGVQLSFLLTLVCKFPLTWESCSNFWLCKRTAENCSIY